MPLKSIVESLDDVPEALHTEYVEKEGKFVLQIDGIDEHPNVRGVITANRENTRKRDALKAEVEALKAKVAAIPEDFDAEEWIRLKAEAPDPNDPDRRKPSDEHLQSQKRLFEQRIANLEKKHADELRAKDGEITERDGQIVAVLVEDGLTKALVEAGVGKEYLKAARAMLKPSVKVVREDDGTRRAVVETDMGEDDVGKFVLNWAQSDEGKVFVSKPTGGDAKGGSGSRANEPNPWAAETRNLTKQGEILRLNPAKARQFMKSAGMSDADIDRSAPRAA